MSVYLYKSFKVLYVVYKGYKGRRVIMERIKSLMLRFEEYFSFNEDLKRIKKIDMYM